MIRMQLLQYMLFAVVGIEDDENYLVRLDLRSDAVYDALIC